MATDNVLDPLGNEPDLEVAPTPPKKDTEQYPPIPYPLHSSQSSPTQARTQQRYSVQSFAQPNRDNPPDTIDNVPLQEGIASRSSKAPTYDLYGSKVTYQDLQQPV